MERKWHNSGIKLGSLRHIFSCQPDTGDGVYRFHLEREGQSWLANDLEGYDELALTAIS